MTRNLEFKIKFNLNIFFIQNKCVYVQMSSRTRYGSFFGFSLVSFFVEVVLQLYTVKKAGQKVAGLKCAFRVF